MPALSAPILGAHRATVGGLHTAFASAREIAAEAMQVFTTSPRQWAARPLTDDALALWVDAWAECPDLWVVSHSSYLLNLASPDPVMHARSAAAYVEELERAQRLGLAGVVLHPGAHLGSGEQAGLAAVAGTLASIYEQHPQLTVPTLIETTAGSGTTLGYRFEHLAALLASIDQPERLGVCLDTAHVHGAGYELRGSGAVTRVLDEFDAVVGLPWLRLIHANDSMSQLGSRTDRHDRIGQGQLGDAVFQALLADPRIGGVPLVVETPGLEHHGEELARLRALAAGGPLDHVEPRWVEQPS